MRQRALVDNISALREIRPQLSVGSGSCAEFGATLKRRSEEIGSQLRPAEVVGIRAPGTRDQAAGFLAVLAAGAVPALLPPRLAAEMPGLRICEVTAAGATLGPPPRDPLQLPPDTVYVQLSGGTTGSATGVTIGAEALDAQLTMMREDLPDGAVAVGWLPLHHDMGLISQLLGPVRHGVRSVLLEPGAWLRDPMSLFTTIAQHNGTNTWMPSFGLAHCLRRIPADAPPVDLSSVRLLGCGGEPIDADVVDAFLERFVRWGLNPAALMAGYGMAEGVCGVTLSRGGAPRTQEVVPPVALGVPILAAAPQAGHRVVSCGRAVGSLRVAVRKDGETLPDRYAGEVCVRGAGLASARLVGELTEPLTEANGWLRTGDVGFTDGGELFVLDRWDDCLVLAGRNVQPSYVERVAVRAAGEGGRSVAAFGVPGPDGRQRLVVVLEHRHAGNAGTRRAVARRVRHAVLHRCGVLPVHVHVTNTRAVLSGHSGKTSRAATRQRYLAQHGEPAERLTVEDVLDLLVSVSGHSQLTPDDALAASDLDSLALVEVLTVLELATGSELDLAGLPREATVADLLALLDGKLAPELGQGAAPGTAAPEPVQRPAPLRRIVNPQRGPVLRGRALPYAVGRSVLAAIARDGALRRSVAGEGLDLVRQCLDDLPGTPRVEEVLRQSVEVNLWTAWYRDALRPSHVHRRWVRVYGKQHLVREPGRGLVLLAPHSPLTFLLEDQPEVASALVVKTRDTGPARRAALYREARGILHRGGTVVVLPDEFTGSGGLPVVVAGRRRQLRWGFARLLEDTGAPRGSVVSRYRTRLAGHLHLRRAVGRGYPGRDVGRIRPPARPVLAGRPGAGRVAHVEAASGLERAGSGGVSGFVAALLPDGPDQALDAALDRAGPAASVLLVAAGTLRARAGRPVLRLEHLALCGTVRLDDRRRLTTALGLADAGSDAQLMLRAWAAGGEACLEHLVGAFAFVVWDGAARRLVGVRDHVGLSPLFYAELAAGGLLLSSGPAPLLAHPGVDAGVDDRAVVAACLNDSGYLLGRTLHRGVRTVPPGSLLSSSGGGLRVRRYWQPSSAAVRRAPADWVAGLRRRVERAVSAAVADEGPFGTHLSGGLDSSAVTALAQRDLRSRGSSLAGVWSWSPPRAALASQRRDERDRIELLAGQLGVPVHYTDIGPDDLRASMRSALDPEALAGLFHERSVTSSAAQHGVRVLLSGWGGDEFASFSGHSAVGGALRSGRSLVAARGAYRRTSGTGVRRAVSAAVTVGRESRSLLPRRWQPRSSVERIVDRMERVGVRPEDVHPEARSALRAARPLGGAANAQLLLLTRGASQPSHRGLVARGTAGRSGVPLSAARPPRRRVRPADP